MKKLIKQLLGKKITQLAESVIIGNKIKATIEKAKAFNGDFSAISTIDLLFSPDSKEITPWQHKEEILELASIIEAKKPKTVLEIGTASGGTLFMACCLAADDALIVSIDLPDGLFGGGYPKWKIPVYKSFKKSNQTIELIQGDSHSTEVIQIFEQILGNRKIDYLFIDGDHSEEGIKKDYSDYSKYLAPGAIVAFHDIAPDREVPPTHFVAPFWDKLKQQYPYKEFIKSPNQDKMGIGVLFMPE
jgi:predicted O-methyltransferase YrrM